MPDAMFTQHAVFVDCGMLRRMSSNYREIIKTVATDEKLKKVFYTAARKPNEVWDTFFNVRTIPQIGIKTDRINNYLLEHWQLRNWAKRHVFNTITDSAFLTYIQRINKVCYCKEMFGTKVVPGLAIPKEIWPIPPRDDFPGPNARKCIPLSLYMKFAEYNRRGIISGTDAVAAYQNICQTGGNHVVYENDDSRNSSNVSAYNITTSSIFEQSSSAHMVMYDKETTEVFKQRCETAHDNPLHLGRITYGYQTSYNNVLKMWMDLIQAADVNLLGNARIVSGYIIRALEDPNQLENVYDNELQILESIAEALIMLMSGRTLDKESMEFVHQIISQNRNIKSLLKKFSQKTNNFVQGETNYISFALAIIVGYMIRRYKQEGKEGMGDFTEVENIFQTQPILPLGMVSNNNNLTNNNNRIVPIPVNNNNNNSTINNSLRFLGRPNNNKINGFNQTQAIGNQREEREVNNNNGFLNEVKEGRKAEQGNGGGTEIKEIKKIKTEEELKEIAKKRIKDDNKAKKIRLEKTIEEFNKVNLPSGKEWIDQNTPAMMFDLEPSQYKLHWSNYPSYTYKNGRNYKAEKHYNKTEWETWVRINSMGIDYSNGVSEKPNLLEKLCHIAGMDKMKFLGIAKHVIEKQGLGEGFHGYDVTVYHRRGQVNPSKFMEATKKMRKEISEIAEKYYGKDWDKTKEIPYTPF